MPALAEDIRRRARLALVLRSPDVVERARKPGRVRTQKGVNRYKQPIGTLIVANVLDNLRSWLRGGQRGPDPLADVQSQADADVLARELGLPAGQSVDSVKAAAVRKVSGDMPARKAAKAPAKKAPAEALAASVKMRTGYGEQSLARLRQDIREGKTTPAKAREWARQVAADFRGRNNTGTAGMSDRAHAEDLDRIADALDPSPRPAAAKKATPAKKAAPTRVPARRDVAPTRTLPAGVRVEPDPDNDRALRITRDGKMIGSATLTEHGTWTGRDADGNFVSAGTRQSRVIDALVERDAPSGPTTTPRKLTPAQAEREFGGDAEAWARGARDGSVARPAAARRIRQFAERLEAEAAIGRRRRIQSDVAGGESHGDTPESLAADREAARLRALADEIEARPAKKATPAKAATPTKAATPAKKATPRKAAPRAATPAPTRTPRQLLDQLHADLHRLAGSDDYQTQSMTDTLRMEVRDFGDGRRDVDDMLFTLGRMAGRAENPTTADMLRKAIGDLEQIRDSPDYQDRTAIRRQFTERLSGIDRRSADQVRAALAQAEDGRISWGEAASRLRGYAGLLRERGPERLQGAGFHHRRESLRAADLIDDVVAAIDSRGSASARPAKKATPRKATRPTAPEGMVRKPFPDSATTPAARVAHLRSIDTREQAQDAIADLKRKDLADIARELSVPGTGSLTVDQLRAEVVQASVGRRLNSIATRGFAGRSPEDPGEPAAEFFRRTRREAGLPPGTESPGSGGRLSAAEPARDRPADLEPSELDGQRVRVTWATGSDEGVVVGQKGGLRGAGNSFIGVRRDDGTVVNYDSRIVTPIESSGDDDEVVNDFGQTAAEVRQAMRDQQLAAQARRDEADDRIMGRRPATTAADTPVTDLSDYRRALDEGLSPRDAAAFAAWVRDNPGRSLAEWQAQRR